MKAETAILEKVHRSTESGRAVCGTVRQMPQQTLRVTLDDKAVTCSKCLRMLRFVDRVRLGVNT